MAEPMAGSVLIEAVQKHLEAALRAADGADLTLVAALIADAQAALQQAI